MPLFRAQIFKTIIGSDREWSNTYLINADTLADAAATAGGIATAEQNFYLDNVQIVRALTSDTDPDTDVFQITPFALTGTRGTAADGDWLPLFNTLRVDIDVTGGGRPSRKYYRLPFLEGDQQAGIVDDTLLGMVNGTLETLIAAANTAGTPLVDPDEQVWLTPVAQSKVQMRQLHRKRRKAVTP